jgi:hypothetical protein
MLKNGFDKMLVGAGFEGALAVNPKTAAGGEDNFGAGKSIGLGAEEAAELETVATGSQLIAKNEVGLFGEGESEAGFAVGGFDHRQPGLPKPAGQGFTNHLVLINYQSSFHALDVLRGPGATKIRRPRGNRFKAFPGKFKG